MSDQQFYTYDQCASYVDALDQALNGDPNDPSYNPQWDVAVEGDESNPDTDTTNPNNNYHVWAWPVGQPPASDYDQCEPYRAALYQALNGEWWVNPEPNAQGNWKLIVYPS